MIALFEARGYKSLRRVSVRLRPFQVIIGPNASGKTNVLEGFSCQKRAQTLTEWFA